MRLRQALWGYISYAVVGCVCEGLRSRASDKTSVAEVLMPVRSSRLGVATTVLIPVAVKRSAGGMGSWRGIPIVTVCAIAHG